MNLKFLVLYTLRKRVSNNNGFLKCIGIGIGMLLIDGESTSLALTTLVLQGLAAGTLVYVAFFEVLERERSKSNIKLLQWTTLALGFLALIGMEALRNPFVVITIKFKKIF